MFVIYASDDESFRILDEEFTSLEEAEIHADHLTYVENVYGRGVFTYEVDEVA